MNEKTLSETTDIFAPSYEMDSNAMSLRIAQSWINKGPLSSVKNLKKLEDWCDENGAVYSNVMNCIAALNWGGKMEFENDFCRM